LDGIGIGDHHLPLDNCAGAFDDWPAPQMHFGDGFPSKFMIAHRTFADSFGGNYASNQGKAP